MLYVQYAVRKGFQGHYNLSYTYMYKISIFSTVCEQALFTLYHMNRSDPFPHRRAPAYLLDLVNSQNIVYSVRAWIL